MDTNLKAKFDFHSFWIILACYRFFEAFNSTSQYLDDLLNIDTNFFDSMVNHIYPSELQLNKANVSDTEPHFLDVHLSISDGFV